MDPDLQDHAALANLVILGGQAAARGLEGTNQGILADFVTSLAMAAAGGLPTATLRDLCRGPASSSHPSAREERVYAALRRWRVDVARTRQIPPYIIATDAVLRAVATTNPATLDDLAAVRGFGPGKLAIHGADILAVVLGA